VKAWLIFTAFIGTLSGLLGAFLGRKSSESPKLPSDEEETRRKAIRLRELIEEKLNEATEDTKALLEGDTPERAVADEFNKRKE
jgi:hypothetical protein